MRKKSTANGTCHLFEVLPWSETVDKVEKAAAKIFFCDTKVYMRKLRKRPTIVVIRVARNRIKLDELASMLIQLDNIQVVLEERTVNAFVEGGSHYRILASKIGSWKVGDWFFNLQGMAKTTGLQLAVGE